MHIGVSSACWGIFCILGCLLLTRVSSAYWGILCILRYLLHTGLSPSSVWVGYPLQVYMQGYALEFQLFPAYWNIPCLRGYSLYIGVSSAYWGIFYILGCLLLIALSSACQCIVCLCGYVHCGAEESRRQASDVTMGFMPRPRRHSAQSADS